MTQKLKIPRKLLPFATAKKRYKVAYGGRGGAKSMTFADLLAMKAQTEGALVGCLREFQNSLDDSVHALLKDEIERLGIPGFRAIKTKIDHESGGGFRFRGLARSIEAVKSMFGFKFFWLEEGQFISDESLRILTPTLRKEESELWISANPMSENDPFSKRFIIPYLNELETKGFYEDDLHYIVKINFRDNPWFPAVLEQERVHDFKTLPRALYDHIWEGAFNDSIDNALISADWFDACIDAHKNLGFEPLGIRFASHDPSDEGPDNKGYAFRHGSVVLDVQEMPTGNVNDGMDWATSLAIDQDADAFVWDGDGMGMGLAPQVRRSFEGKHSIISMFRGAETPDFPDALYEPAEAIQKQKTNKEAFKNKRAQRYFKLRDRIIRTYQAVVEGKYHDPAEMISFSSSIPIIGKLRSELCRMPVKPNGNGMFELYTKDVMKSKFKMPSPNLADSVMMLTIPPKTQLITTSKRPAPIRVIGKKPKYRRVA